MTGHVEALLRVDGLVVEDEAVAVGRPRLALRARALFALQTRGVVPVVSVDSVNEDGRERGERTGLRMWYPTSEPQQRHPMPSVKQSHVLVFTCPWSPISASGPVEDGTLSVE